MSWFESTILWLREVLSSVLTIPNSSLFIFAVTFGLVLVVMIIYRSVTDIKKLQDCELEIRKYTRNLNEAKGRNDKAVLRRLKREEIRLKHFRAYASKQRLKATLITVLPLTFIYFILSIIYLGQQVATFPIEIPIIGRDVPFYIWYLLCYLTMYLSLSRAFGVSPNVELPAIGRSNTKQNVSRKSGKAS